MKKIFCTLILVFALYISSDAACIYSYKTQTPMTGGVTLYNVKKFYSDYNLNINCVEADLTNEHLSLKLLKNAGGCDKVDYVSNLAKSAPGVVAAANGDFFSYYSGSQNFSLGIEIADGKLLQSHINTDTMASGIFDGETLNLSYISFEASVKAKNGETMKIAHINKPTNYYGSLLMYTSDFNGAVSPFLPRNITVVTVTDGVVTAKGISLGGTVPIPENGYILVIDDNMTPFLETNFEIADDVMLTVQTDPSIENAAEAFGGGTMLLSGGKKTPVTHKVNGYNPRTAIGTNKDGTVVYIITVDGRQSISRGVTLDELADICLELGCDNALNLDGGGSTNLQGKTFENNTIHTINSPSENRKVINAVSIVTDAQPGESVGLVVKPDAYNVLKGDSVSISVSAYDENYNPASVINEKISWQVPDGKGRVVNNVFYADEGGKVTAHLYYNNVWQASCEFNVMDDICGIITEPVYNLNFGESISQSIASVYDENGNMADVKDISLLKPVCDLSFLSFENGRIKPLREGAGTLVISYGNAVRTVKIVCGKGDIISDEAITFDKLQKYSGKEVISIFAGSYSDTLFGKINYNRIKKKILDSVNCAVTGGNTSLYNLKEKSIFTADVYKTFYLDNTLLISLNLSGGTLRKSGQWDNFVNDLNSANEKNIILILNSPPFITDELEADVFGDVLKNIAVNKNIYVVYNGDENISVINSGVRYISIGDIDDYSSVRESMLKMKYLSFRLDEKGNLCYTFDRIYPTYY